LELVAVALSTQPDRTCSAETVAALVAILSGLLSEQLNDDALYMSMLRARHVAKKNGVDSEEFERVSEIVISHWSKVISHHPLRGLFQ
jgi:hypothetical protein